VTHVRLTKGSSTTKLLRFTADVPPGLVSIGSGPGVSWLVTGEGVCANHLELFWDGKVLWVTETHQGEVDVDGEPVGNAPKRVYRGRVSFGECSLVVDTIFAAEVRPLSRAQWEALREELEMEEQTQVHAPAQVTGEQAQRAAQAAERVLGRISA